MNPTLVNPAHHKSSSNSVSGSPRDADCSVSQEVPVARVQRLAEDVLAAGGIVAEIEPVACPIPSPGQCALDRLAGRAGIDATDEQVRGLVVVPLQDRS
jgi:hypothetical protein